jgi:ABC-type transport system involved in multi-copper enzyme maturation permease subunit
MKLLAILKDSFREATDTRVFAVLLAFTAGLVLTFASLGFTPRPARDLLLGTSLANLEDSLARAGSGAGDSPPIFRLRAVEPVAGAPDRPGSPLRFLVLAQFVAPADAERTRRDPAPIEAFLGQRFGRFGGVPAFEVTAARVVPAGDPTLPAPPNNHQVYFEVTTRPTAGTLRVWPHDSSLLFGALPLSGGWQFLLRRGGPPAPGPSTPDEEEAPPLGVQVLTFEELLVSGLGSWGTVLVSICVTSFFVPSMLHKGTLDLLLVKPLWRWRLLVYKYLGGLVFIAVNAALAVGGVWLVLGLRSGVWCHALLLLVPLLTFSFAVLYAVSVLVSVLTHSPVVSILITCLVWVLLWGVGWAHLHVYGGGPGRPEDPVVDVAPPVATAVDALHCVLPRTGDINLLTSQLLSDDLTPETAGVPLAPANLAPRWGETVGVSCLFIAVVLGLACVRFSTRDY